MSDDVRELFRREAAAIEAASPDAAAVRSAGRRRLRWRRALSASTVAVVALATVAAATQIADPDPPAPASTDGRLAVVARVRLAESWQTGPGGVGDMAYGLGYVWAFTGREPTLQRIDPVTNRVDKVLSLGTGIDGLFWDVEAGFGRLWLTDPHQRRVLVLDPASGEVTDTVEGVVHAMSVLVADGRVWVQASDTSRERQETIHLIDPETLEISGSLPMGSECCVSGMVEHDGYLWIAHSDVADTARNPGADHDDVELDLTNELRKVDPETMEVVDAIRLPGDTYRPGDTVLGDVTAAAGYLWVSMPDERTVLRVDPASRAVEQVAVDGMRPDALSHFDGRVWAWEVNGSLMISIDPATLEVGPVSDLGENVTGSTVEGAGSLWRGAEPTAEGETHLLRVDSADEAAPDTPTPAPPPDPTAPPAGDLVETVTEREQAEIFAFRALARAGLMHPYSKRSYNFTSFEDTTRVDGAWRIGLAASDCEPNGGTYTCTGLSGEDPRSGSPFTDTYVTVELDGDVWAVTGVDGNMPEQDRDRIVGHTQRWEPGPSHWEFPAVGVWSSDDGADMVSMQALWVGPYPTKAPPSVCTVTFLDASGNPVGEPDRFYQDPPNRPFERDGGWSRGLELGGFDGDVESVEVECYQKGA